ncbi:MAG: type II toxin-antitoxin system VapC family toxin [Thermococcus sp.]|uniref:type II toxin-antitoxin system VapC family toxin n=1 Tax=Thermococcus sp. TaxID=35749 RepID=UPI001DF62ABC|nr:type II toxin-antitoxin system VapC family toxin [Thermococcus sp.]MBO8174999.1 type II toxin-antitoxin system VapC family toxin [Thermococcus sp.]
MDGLLDTSVIIEIFRGNKKVLDTLVKKGLIYGVSTITLFELHCGTLKEREELMLEKLPKLEFEEESAKIAGKIYRDLKRKGKLPPAKDLLIAASAIAHDKILFTCDDDFEIFRKYGLKLELIPRNP